MITGMMLALAGRPWLDYAGLIFWTSKPWILASEGASNPSGVLITFFFWIWMILISGRNLFCALRMSSIFLVCLLQYFTRGPAVVGMVLWSWWSREVCPLPWYLLLSGLVAWRWPKGPRHTQIVKSHGSCWIFLVPTQALYMSYIIYYIDYLLNDEHICFSWLKPQRSLDSKNRLWSWPVKGSCCLHAMVHSARHEVDSDLIAILTYIMMTLHQPDLTSFWKTYPY